MEFPKAVSWVPFSFWLMVSPLGDIIRKHGLYFHSFADDTQLYLAFDANSTDNPSDALRSIQLAILDIKNWLSHNLLNFNIGKIELLLIGSSHQLFKLCSPITICVDDVTITASEIVRNLGVFIDEQLKLDDHVNKIIKTCFYHLRNIFKSRKYLSIDATKSLVHALVTSRLDYCNSLLYGCKTSSIKRFQRIQNYSALAICKIAKYDHISPVLKQLHWLPVKARIEYKLLTLTFKAVHGQAPSYLSELISRRPTLRPGLRSNHGLLLTVPKITSRADKSTADRAFSLSAPKLWNSLPEELRNCSSIETFKGKLKRFYLQSIFSIFYSFSIFTCNFSVVEFIKISAL